MSNYRDLINNNIKRLRDSHKLTQEKFAEYVGISIEGYRNLEHNKYAPKPETIDKICSAFNITPFDLLMPEMTKGQSVEIADIVNKLKLCNTAQLNIINGIIDVIRKNG